MVQKISDLLYLSPLDRDSHFPSRSLHLEGVSPPLRHQLRAVHALPGGIQDTGGIAVVADSSQAPVHDSQKILRVRGPLDQPEQAARLSPKVQAVLQPLPQPVAQQGGVVHPIALLQQPAQPLRLWVLGGKGQTGGPPQQQGQHRPQLVLLHLVVGERGLIAIL